MKIKTKLIIAVSLLFLMITVLSAIGIRQVNVLAGETKNILTDNYHSLDYSRNMYKILDEQETGPDLQKFRGFLEKQQKNVTETGEDEITSDLAEHFSALEKNPKDSVFLEKVRIDLNAIMKLNMDAIQRKSNSADKTADDSIVWMSLVSSFCFIIGFTLIINLPGYIANPIRDLTESIRQIAAKNYSQRLYFKGHDEFTTLAKSFNSMAEKLQEYNASDFSKLMMEKKRIETLIDTLHDPVIGLDEKNRILFINEAALKVTGLANEDLIGRQSEEIALHNDLIRSLLQHLVSEESKQNETLKIFCDNKESYFEKQIVNINIVPTGETEKKEIGSFIILRNITPHKELDAAKTNFIATVSHEFKTPIASMKMSLQLLENQSTGTLNTEQQELVSGLKDDTERLLRTTGELLNITQVETGKSELKIESCDVSEIVDDAVLATQKLAKQKSVIIHDYLENSLPDIICDKEKATWIISNLLSNAVRYSYENASIEIKNKVLPMYVEILVADHGTGIDPQFQERVFDRYFRVPGTEKEGTGLGLAISKEFIEAMGGYINLSSGFGSGTTFTVGFKRDA